MTTKISNKSKRRKIQNYCKKIRNCKKLRYNFLKLKISMKPESNHYRWINCIRSSLCMLGVVKEKIVKFLGRVCLVAPNTSRIMSKETLERIIKSMI